MSEENEVVEQVDLVPWRKGNPRTVDEATACVHLNRVCLVQPQESEKIVKNPVAMPGEPNFRTVKVVTGRPIQRVELICTSPAYLAETMKGFLPQYREPRLQGLVLGPGLSLCICCPFFEAPTLM